MRWMKGWSWDELNAAPPEVVNMIVRMINEEQEYLKSLENK